MVCKKCGYLDKNEKSFFGQNLCSFCSKFAPKKIILFQEYLDEKTDWKSVEPYRKYLGILEINKKEGMQKVAKKGLLVTRPPLGYDVQAGDLVQNEEASKVHSLFKTFLNRKYSLNSLAKNFGLSVNGIKKILTNRTYLGEIKFDGNLYESNHEPIISPEIFYAVQRKLKEEYVRPRKKEFTNRYN